MNQKDVEEKDDEKEDIESEQQRKAKALRCRDHALLELVETEKTYVNGLGKLIIIYMNPLKQDNYQILSISDHQTIFPSVVSTIYNLHNQLLAELDYNYHSHSDEEAGESITVKVGKVLLKYAELFKMYQIYMNGYERASKALQVIKKKNRRFNKWLQSQCVKTSLCAGDLESLLILPIQRIPRYQLLLKEIIKQTEKISLTHSDLHDLRKAYEQILEITKLIEEKMKEYDNKKKVAIIEQKFNNINPGYLVTPSRYYIMESKPKNIKIHHIDGTTVDIIVILFNDCLIYGHFNDEMVSSLTSKAKLCLDHTMLFDSLFRCEVEDNYKRLFCLKIYARRYSVWLSFASHRLRAKWLKAINEANDLVNNKYLRNLQRFNALNGINQQYLNLQSSANTQDEQTMPYPCFVPDDYSDKCQQCNIKFTFTNRKHHCRQCGRLLCKTCTNYRINSVFNKSHKNQIIRCCKQCKDDNTFSALSKPTIDEEPRRVSVHSNTNTAARYNSASVHIRSGRLTAQNSTIQTEPHRATVASPPLTTSIASANNSNDSNDSNSRRYHEFDHGYHRHMELYNRMNRTRSTPAIKTPPLKSLSPSPYDPKHRSSTPLLLNSSSTTTVAMKTKSPSLKAARSPHIKTIRPMHSASTDRTTLKSKPKQKHGHMQSPRKAPKKGPMIPISPLRDSSSIIMEDQAQPATPNTAVMTARTRQKYTDKMPQSPHLNPPQEHGYNNDDDDSLDDEDDNKSLSDLEQMDRMPSLDLTSRSEHVQTQTGRRMDGSQSQPKEITVIQAKTRRTRSYAVGLLNECNLSTYVGCVITDEDTDGSSQSLMDQLVASTSGASCPSSGDSKDSSLFSSRSISKQKKKNRHQRGVSFRFPPNESTKNAKHKHEGNRKRSAHHVVSKSFHSILD